MLNFNMEDLQYHILPVVSRSPEIQRLHNQNFKLWLSVWQETYDELGLSEPNFYDEYTRQNIISSLVYKNEVIGCHLYSFFPLESLAHLNSSYMASNYPEAFLKALTDKNCKLAMSWEYLTVNPNWRKQKSGIPFGQILLGLASKIMKQTDSDVAIAPTRNSRRVNEMTFQLGAVAILKNIKNHNVQADLIALFRNNLKESQDPVVKKFVRTLWNKRTDHYFKRSSPTTLNTNLDASI